MRKIVSLVLACILLLGVAGCGSKQEALSDVSKTDPYYEYIQTAYEQGIVTGYDNGTFLSERNISTGEFVKAVAFAAGAEEEVFEARHWAFRYWEYLDKYDAFEGTEITGLRQSLDAGITMGDAARVLYNMLTNSLGEVDTHVDNPGAIMKGYLTLDESYLDAVAQLYAKGIITLQEGEVFDQNDFLQRGEATSWIIKLFDKNLRTENSLTPGGLSSGAAKKFDFNERTLFVGDEFMYQLLEEYMIPNGLIGRASYMAAPGTTARRFIGNYWLLEPEAENNYSVCCSSTFSGLSMAEVIQRTAGKFDTVIFCVGFQDNGNLTKKHYRDALKLIHNYNPTANIYVLTIPIVKGGDSESVQNLNASIQEGVNLLIQQQDSSVTGVTEILDLAGQLTEGSYNEAELLTDEGLVQFYEFLCSSLSARS
jgi:hypothetical protein